MLLNAKNYKMMVKTSIKAGVMPKEKYIELCNFFVIMFLSILICYKNYKTS